MYGIGSLVFVLQWFWIPNLGVRLGVCDDAYVNSSIMDEWVVVKAHLRQVEGQFIPIDPHKNNSESLMPFSVL